MDTSLLNIDGLIAMYRNAGRTWDEDTWQAVIGWVTVYAPCKCEPPTWNAVVQIDMGGNTFPVALKMLRGQFHRHDQLMLITAIDVVDFDDPSDIEIPYEILAVTNTHTHAFAVHHVTRDNVTSYQMELDYTYATFDDAQTLVVDHDIIADLFGLIES